MHKHYSTDLQACLYAEPKEAEGDDASKGNRKTFNNTMKRHVAAGIIMTLSH
jgi:hypothetical protein